MSEVPGRWRGARQRVSQWVVVYKRNLGKVKKKKKKKAGRQASTTYTAQAFWKEFSGLLFGSSARVCLLLGTGVWSAWT